jgi:hypothetical protein
MPKRAVRSRSGTGDEERYGALTALVNEPIAHIRDIGHARADNGLKLALATVTLTFRREIDD